MPKAHQKYVGRTPSRLIEDAHQTGPYTGQLVEAILAAKRHPEQGYRSCLGILRLAKLYPAERVEAAARRCLRARAHNSQSMDSILKNQLDRLPLPGDPPVQSAVNHENIRGADYFDTPTGDDSVRFTRRTMLNQQTIEKLYAMRMRGMAEAFTQQQEEPETAQLSFEERFALLVDRQWNWRQNRALERRLREGRLQGPACMRTKNTIGLWKCPARANENEARWLIRRKPSIPGLCSCGNDSPTGRLP